MTNKTRLLIIFALVYFFSPNGLAALPNQPIAYLLKEGLKLTAAQAAYFSAITILGWAIKPLWGFISDTLPLFGSRRRSYLILVSLVAAAGWLVLALTHNYTVGFLLLVLTLSSFAYAFQDVVTDALMIELGKKEKALAEFQSVQWLGVYLAQILVGVAGGWAAANLSSQTTFGIAIFFPLIIALLALLLLKQEPQAETRFKHFFAAIKTEVFKKEYLLITLFIFLWRFSPSYGTPFFYYQIDQLKFSKIFIGILASLGAIGSTIGALLFKIIAPKIALRKLIIFSVLAGGILTFFSLIYLAPNVKSNLPLAKALAVSEALVLAPIGSIAFLTLLTFAAEKTSTVAAGTMFAFITAVMNLGLMGSDALGGFLYDKIGLAPLIIVSGVTSLLILVFIPFLKTESENQNTD
jgi:MFS family permease